MLAGWCRASVNRRSKGARRFRPRGPLQPSSRPTLRRPAPARRDRPRDHHAAGAARRRAHGNLDRATGQEVTRLLEALNANGVTLIVVTHDPVMGDRAAPMLMVDGADRTGPAQQRARRMTATDTLRFAWRAATAIPAAHRPDGAGDGHRRGSSGDAHRARRRRAPLRGGRILVRSAAT